MSCEERTCWQVYVRTFSDLLYATPHETSRLQESVFVETTLFNLDELRRKGTTSIVRAGRCSSCVGTRISPSVPRREPMAERTAGTRDSPSPRWAGPALLACTETPGHKEGKQIPQRVERLSQSVWDITQLQLLPVTILGCVHGSSQTKTKALQCCSWE